MKPDIVAGQDEFVPGHTEDWQSALRTAVRDPRQLCRILGLPEELGQSADRAAEDFATLVPWEFIRRMEPGNARDPLLLQVLPQRQELDDVAGFVLDAVGDRAATSVAGLLQKYSRRALLLVSGHCAAHCRYCFRRHFSYDDAGPGSWKDALEQLQRSPEVDELILSGGDPLSVSDDRLAHLVAAVSNIHHIRRLRIHTRLPILIPQRVTENLLDTLESARCRVWVVVHVNHPQELDKPVEHALAQIRRRGIPLLNQTVLLKGINDRTDVLDELFRRLVDLGCLPYYLHQLDRVRGTAHFETPEDLGRDLLRQLRRQLPGYAVPRFVREAPGAPHKEILA